jgi:cyclin-dependent kinase 8/11
MQIDIDWYQQLAKQLSHENVVALRDVIFEDKTAYIVFDYADYDFYVVPHDYRCVLH